MTGRAALISPEPRRTHQQRTVGGLLAVLLLGFFLRVHALNRLPPGWRDDEVIETTVHAERVLSGDWPLYFTEASGHEPLYHYLSAGAIAAWGRGLFQVRLLSAFLGLLALAAHYRLARRLFGPHVALIATLAMAFSFWALMYSRVKIRHIAVLPFVLLAFDELVRVLRVAYCVLERSPNNLRSKDKLTRNTQHATRNMFLTSLFLALSLYTYPAARFAPVVLIAFAVYLAVWHRERFAAHWKRIVGILGLTAVFALPLLIAILSQPGASARLEEVGRPLQALLAGDPSLVLQGALTTAGMFAWTGDPEALYNLPSRPVFEPIGVVLFGAGLVVSLVRGRDPRHAFVLIWLVIGLLPAVLSLPAASLGHAILAQPAAYLLLAIGLVFGLRLLRRLPVQFDFRALSLVVGGMLLAFPAVRDLRDYFVRWPSDPMVRHLYRADIHEAALLLEQRGIENVALNGRLSLWDARALELDAPRVRARWFNPETAWLYPAEPSAAVILFPDPPTTFRGWAEISQGYDPETSPAGPFTLWMPRPDWQQPSPTQQDGPSWPVGIAFGGLEVIAPAQPGQTLDLRAYWIVNEDYQAPAPAIGDSPDPPPQPFTTFVHVLAADGSLIAGFDRFDVDAFSLRPGDLVLQHYRPELPPDLPAGAYTLAVGLYDPVTQMRFQTTEGLDNYIFATLQVGQ